MVFAGAALGAAIALGLLSFFQTGSVTTNMLILVAQFLVYSLTMVGLGEAALKLLTLLKNENYPTFQPRGADGISDGEAAGNQQHADSPNTNEPRFWSSGRAGTRAR